MNDQKVTTTCQIELRETEGRKPRLQGVIVQEGRAAAGGRAELFVPGSITWPESGIAIRTEHRGSEEVRAVPVRDPNGEIRISAVATPAIVAAVADGKNRMSVEFYALQEHRTAAGVREVLRALVDGAAMTSSPEYEQASAEIRSIRRRRVWL